MHTGPHSKNVEIIGTEVLYQGHHRLSRYRLRHSLFAGGMGREIKREVIERGDAVAVLPYDPMLDEVVLIEQFRIGAEVNGDQPWLIEIVAGLMDPGETDETVARRETREEAGLEIRELWPIVRYYTTPGASTERIALFCGLVDASGAGGIHGLDEEGEDIRVKRVPFAQIPALFDAGLLNNSPSLIALQWLMLNRDRLRAEGSA